MPLATGCRSDSRTRDQLSIRGALPDFHAITLFKSAIPPGSAATRYRHGSRRSVSPGYSIDCVGFTWVPLGPSVRALRVPVRVRFPVGRYETYVLAVPESNRCGVVRDTRPDHSEGQLAHQLSAGHGPLAAPQYHPAAVHEVARPHDGLGIRHSLVVDVRATFLDGAPGLVET